MARDVAQCFNAFIIYVRPYFKFLKLKILKIKKLKANLNVYQLLEFEDKHLFY